MVMTRSRALLIWLYLWVPYMLFIFNIFTSNLLSEALVVGLRWNIYKYTIWQFSWTSVYLISGSKSSPANGMHYSLFVLDLWYLIAIEFCKIKFVFFFCFGKCSKPGSRQCRTPLFQRISFYYAVLKFFFVCKTQTCDITFPF